MGDSAILRVERMKERPIQRGLNADIVMEERSFSKMVLTNDRDRNILTIVEISIIKKKKLVSKPDRNKQEIKLETHVNIKDVKKRNDQIV